MTQMYNKMKAERDKLRTERDNLRAEVEKIREESENRFRIIIEIAKRAKALLPNYDTEGDSHGVPCLIDHIDTLIAEVERLRKRCSGQHKSASSIRGQLKWEPLTEEEKRANLDWNLFCLRAEGRAI